MQTLLILVALTAPLVLCYDEIYDKIDVDKILADDSMFNSYINCMLDKGDCTLEHSSDFKKLLPEVIATACAKCSPIQRGHVRKSVLALKDRKPAEFEEFQQKYDPKGDYVESFTKFLLGSD